MRQVEPSATGSLITLSRKQAIWTNRLAKYWVLIDGNRVGGIANGATREFAVSPGEHRIRLVISKVYTSPERVIVLRDGQNAYFSCHPAFPAISGIVSLSRPRHYIALEEQADPRADEPQRNEPPPALRAVVMIVSILSAIVLSAAALITGFVTGRMSLIYFSAALSITAVAPLIIGALVMIVELIKSSRS